MELEGTWKCQKYIEGNGIGRNLEISKIYRRKWNWKKNLKISKIDKKKWNWKKHGNLENRSKEMELEGIWKSQKQMEGNVNGRNLEISKMDVRKCYWKEPGNLKNRWMERGTGRNLEISILDDLMSIFPRSFQFHFFPYDIEISRFLPGPSPSIYF